MKQVVFANKIMVSFVDVVGEARYDHIEKSLADINC
jgi:G3E family GTPase